MIKKEEDGTLLSAKEADQDANMRLKCTMEDNARDAELAEKMQFKEPPATKRKS